MRPLLATRLHSRPGGDPRALPPTPHASALPAWASLLRGGLHLALRSVRGNRAEKQVKGPPLQRCGHTDTHTAALAHPGGAHLLFPSTHNTSPSPHRAEREGARTGGEQDGAAGGREMLPLTPAPTPVLTPALTPTFTPALIPNPHPCPHPSTLVSTQASPARSLPSSLGVRSPALDLEVNPHPQAHPGSCPSDPGHSSGPDTAASCPRACFRRTPAPPPSPAASQQDPLSLLWPGAPSPTPGAPASSLSLSRPLQHPTLRRTGVHSWARELSPMATLPAQVCPLALASPHTGGFKAQRELLRDAPDCPPGQSCPPPPIAPETPPPVSFSAERFCCLKAVFRPVYKHPRSFLHPLSTYTPQPQQMGDRGSQHTAQHRGAAHGRLRGGGHVRGGRVAERAFSKPPKRSLFPATPPSISPAGHSHHESTS